MQKCWNWFSAADQSAGRGEPSLIAGITRQVMADYAVDPARVFVAGLSAGGAAAAVMGDAYPDLYAAIGVHSGLACGAAHDMPSAFAAMRQERGRRTVAAGRADGPGHRVPWRPGHDRQPAQRRRRRRRNPRRGGTRARTRGAGRSPGGRALHPHGARRRDGRTVAEHWLVHGAGACLVGRQRGRLLHRPAGPDASAEMVRFFLQVAAA